jgi:hypothetical protein
VDVTVAWLLAFVTPNTACDTRKHAMAGVGAGHHAVVPFQLIRQHVLAVAGHGIATSRGGQGLATHPPNVQ